jgi:hypothetical protein
LGVWSADVKGMSAKTDVLLDTCREGQLKLQGRRTPPSVHMPGNTRFNTQALFDKSLMASRDGTANSDLFPVCSDA